MMIVALAPVSTTASTPTPAILHRIVKLPCPIWPQLMTCRSSEGSSPSESAEHGPACSAPSSFPGTGGGGGVMVGPGYPYWPGAELVAWGPVALPFAGAFPCAGHCTPAADGPSCHNCNTASGTVSASDGPNCIPPRFKLGYPPMASLASPRGPTASVRLSTTDCPPPPGPFSQYWPGRPW